MQFKLPLLLIATFFIDSIWTKDCAKLKSNTKLFCYYSDIQETGNFCQCTHIVLPEKTELKIVEKIRKQNGDVKILVTVSEFNEKLVSLLKGTQVDGVELNLRKIDSKNDLTDFISTVKSKLGSEHYIAVSVPSKTESVAKHFDFKELSKHADVFVLNTAFLGASQNVTFHPSRLSGLWDMQNTDSMVDLVSGLGAPLSKIVIAAPVQAFSFTLQNEEYTAPGSPATEVKSITRKELCDFMQQKGVEWTLERDQDQAGPYIFRGNQWIAFEDETSIDIKTKYARVRSLAGVALKDLSQDSETKCGSSILNAAFKGLSKQARAPRGAVLHTLEREILSPSSIHSASVHDSPFRISRIIDTEGKIHVVRQDTRTEFECSRQGYFVHPRSCNRFYRCVKFDQRTEEYNVFEFDCPAGLTFDEKTEVCVWPGSLPHASACSGSSEIAPVPQKRFSCPTEPGYYADPENCRWFFACLDHGEPSMQAYEFRCPFGLVFDEEKLLCEWPWMVPKCGLGAAVTLNYYGGVSTNNINQYEGLGVLQTVKLGGLQGPLQAAEAKTYSNVGFVGLSDKALNDAKIFSENSARFIDASRRLGLSLKATQSLYNAGLLSEKLAAIGVKDDFGLDNLASQVNIGLQQNGLGFGQQLDGFEYAGAQFGQQNQLAGHNVVSVKESLEGNGGRLGLNFNAGATLQSGAFGANSGQYLSQSNIDQLKAAQAQGNSGSYNLYKLNSQGQNENVQLNVENSAYQPNIEGAEQYEHKLSGLNSYSTSSANADQFSQDNVGGQQQNIDQSQFSSGQLTVGNIGLKQDVIDAHKYNSNLGSNSYSTSYVNVGQASDSQLGLQNYNIGTGLNQQSQLGLGGGIIDKHGLNQNNIDNARGTSYSSYVTSGISQGSLSPGQSERAQLGLEQLNVDYSGVNQGSIEGYKLKIEGGIQNNQQHSENLKTSGYSSSYFNSGQSSGIPEQKHNIAQDQNIQLNLNNQNIQTQNIHGINVGLSDFRQNGGILLQNVEINGAAGSYTDDIHQSNSNIAVDSGDFSHVTPASVSHTTASSFESIVSATPLKTVDNYKQKQYVDNGIEYSINNLQEPVQTLKFEQNGVNQAASYQYIQKEQPSFISSTPSSIHIQDTSKESRIEFGSQSKSTLNVPQYQVASSTVRPLTQEFNIQTGTSPEVNLQGKSQITYSHQSPAVSFIASGEQGIISEQAYSKYGGYSYEKPTIAFEEKSQTVVSSTPTYVSAKVTPSVATSYSYTNEVSGDVRYQNILEGKSQVLSQQPVISVASTPSTGSSSNYFRQDTRKISYQTPQLIQQPQVTFDRQVVSGFNFNKPEISQTSQTLQVQQPQIISKQHGGVATSYNYINQEQPTQQQPNILLKQSEVSSYSYIQPEIKKEVIVGQPQGILKKPEAILTSYNYVRPTVQSQIVYEQPQISFKKPATIEPNYNFVKPQVQEVKPVLSQSFSYTQQHARGSYKYEVPQVSVQEQPQFIAQKPTVSTSFDIREGYKYEKPSVAFEEQSKVVQPINQQQVVQPAIQNKLLVQKQIYQPIVQKQEIPSYQYFQPVVQQPRGFTKTTFQEEAVKTYSYSNPVRTQYIAKPATITTTNYRAPVFKSEQIEFKGYGYPKPQVQFAEEPEPIVTNYEGKVPIVETPIVPKKAYVLGNSFQYQKRIPTVHVLKEQPAYTTPKPTLISTIDSFVTQKASSVPQREFIYYDSRLDNTRQNQYFQASAFKPAETPVVSYAPTVSQNVEIKGYQYPKPTFKFDESPKRAQHQTYQYYQTNQVIKQRPIQVQPQIVRYTTSRPTFVSTIKSIVSQKDDQFFTTQPGQIQYLESTTLKPVSTVTTSYLPAVEQKIQNVEINGYVDRKQQIESHQYIQQNEPQKQVVVENFVQQQYDRPAYYTTESPIKRPVAQEYFYYDSRLTSTESPKIQYIETSTRTPIVQKTQQVEFQGYDYPKPDVSFEEPKTVITSYENKVPVVEAPIVPKKAYVTTGQSYTYNQNVNVEQQTAKSIVLENYVASNYQQHSSNSQLEQIDYVTPRPTYASTIASIVAQKSVPVQQEFRYVDNRYSSPKTRLTAQRVEVSSSRGYNYPKPQVQLLEEPKLNTIEVQKVPQPVVLENYVSPAYQKYDVSFQSSTPATVLSQNIKEEVLQYDRRSRPQLVKINQAPLNLKISTPTPVVVQKLEQEQPREPFFYYDSRLSPPQNPQIEVVQEKEEVPEVYRQEISSYDSRYSTSGGTTVEIKSRPSVTFIERPNPTSGALLDEYTTIGRRVKVNKPSQEYLPAITTPSSVYIPSSTSGALLDEYTTIRRRTKVGNPSREYPTTPSSVYSASSAPGALLDEYTTIGRRNKVGKPLREYPTTPISAYSASSAPGALLDEYTTIGRRVKVNKPSQEYLPAFTTPSSVYIPSSTSGALLDEYTTIGRRTKVGKPSRVYPTTPSSVYLASSAPGALLDEYTTIGRRTKVVKPSREYPTTPSSVYSASNAPGALLDEYTTIGRRLKVNKPSREYLPASTTPSSVYTPSSTSGALLDEYTTIRRRTKVAKPSREYPTTPSSVYSASSASGALLDEYTTVGRRVKVNNPSREYLPALTIPSSEYLPIVSSESPSEGSVSVENYENFELVRKKSRPVKVVKIVRPRVKTVVVKKNDFNPFLSAKLGAQCTCTSNTIELRKEPLRIEVSDDDQYENNEGGEAIVVENYESEKLDTVTDEPEVYIRSSTVEIPSSTYRLQKVNRGGVRAQNIVVEDISSRRTSEINVKASDVNIVASRVRVKTPRVDIVTDGDSEVNVETGRTKASLVAVESAENIGINSKNFDRYGPGGLRSATETLQGIDCQRAGLFRHPTQCNKFYSCRWDCKKEKFTLHVFNCPVHLTFDNNLGACNWPSQGPACLENTLLPSE